MSVFGITVSVAFVVAGLLMQRDFARKGVATDLAWSIVVAGMVGGLTGAHLEYALQHWPQLVERPGAFLRNWSGLVWYGGLAGGVLATAWPIHRAGIGWATAADTAAPALALGLAIARIGCHLSGDGDWGTPTTLPWGVAYLHGVHPWPHAPGVVVHPAALYECVALVAVFALLWRRRLRPRPAGTLFAEYLVLTGGIRFLIECVRTNEPILWSLTQAQWISLALVAGGGWWLARTRRARAQAPESATSLRATAISGAAGG